MRRLAGRAVRILEGELNEFVSDLKDGTGASSRVLGFPVVLLDA